jgi:hypothetical protein
MPGLPPRPGSIDVFCSYAHEDERLLKELLKHLGILKRLGVIRDWHDRRITAGSEWKGQIDGQLESAEVVLLLVSANFLASDYCYDVEMKRALQRHEAAAARVIPIILRPSDWLTAPFGKLQALPRDGKPVTTWKNRDEAFADVARGIREAASSLSARAANSTAAAKPSSDAPNPPLERSQAVDRLALAQALMRLSPSSWEALVAAISGAASQISRQGTIPERAAELIRWAESIAGPGLMAVEAAIQMLQNPSSSTWPPSGTLAAGRPFWNVPFPRNLAFTGREDILADLRVSLTERGRTALAQAINGVGGIGKTQAAVEYAYRYRGQYRAVLWLNAESPLALKAAFGEIARRMQLTLPETDLDQDVLALKHWLETHSGWLLVFDNADDPATLVPLLPAAEHGHILITTRARGFQDLGILDPVELPELPVAEATDFLLLRCSREGADAAERAAAEELARELGGLPLALELAAAYIAASGGASFVSYLNDYRQRGLRRLEARDPALKKYPRSVAATSAANLDAAQAESPAAADVLRLSAFLAPEDIPFELVRRGVPGLGRPTAEALVGAAAGPPLIHDLLRPLARYSLVRIDAEREAYGIDHLVQEVIKGAMDESTRRVWCERAVRAVSQIFPPAEYQTWPQCERLLPHALTVVSGMERNGIQIAESGYLLNEIAYYFYERAQYADAEPLSRKAMKIRRTALGEQHPDYVASLNNLASLYRAMGRHSEADLLLRQAMEIRRTVLGEQHPNYAASLNNLASLYRAMGRHAEAEPLLSQATEIRRTALGELHPDYAASLNNLASLYRAMGRDAEAEPLLRQAMEIRRSALGEQHPDYAASLNSLAMLYESTGRHAEAEPLLVRSVEIRRTVLGEQHPDYAASLNNLASLHRAMGRDAEAQSLYRQVGEIYRTAQGEQHPDYAASASVPKLVARDAKAEPSPNETIKGKQESENLEKPKFESHAKLPITLIFPTIGVPKYNYVAPIEFARLKTELQTLGRGLIIEGPSRTGKTTATIKAIEEIATEAPRLWLDGTNPTDLRTLERCLDSGFQGYLFIDDFHYLPDDKQDHVAWAIKRLADRLNPDSKIVVIGINRVGYSLVAGRPEISGRVQTISLSKPQPPTKVFELIDKGEDVANVRFQPKEAVVEAAGGSFFIAQQICYHLAVKNGIRESQSECANIEFEADWIRKEFLETLGPTGRIVLNEFATIDHDGPNPGAALILLGLLRTDRDHFVLFDEAAKQYPRFEPALQWLASNGVLNDRMSSPRHSLREAKLEDYFYFDARAGRIEIHDVQLIYYLNNMNWPEFARRAGYSSEIRGNRVTVRRLNQRRPRRAAIPPGDLNALSPEAPMANRTSAEQPLPQLGPSVTKSDPVNRLVNYLSDIPAFSDQANRSILLKGLPKGPSNTIARHSATWADLHSIVQGSLDMRRLRGRKTLAIEQLLDNVIPFVQGLELESELDNLRQLFTA